MCHIKNIFLACKISNLNVRRVVRKGSANLTRLCKGDHGTRKVEKHRSLYLRGKVK